MSTSPLKTAIVYPDSDGAPMAESDATRDYLTYSVEALRLYFQNRSDVYVSGNLFIYYQRGVPDAVLAPDVFVIFGVANRKHMSYKAWEEGGKLPDFVLEITSKSTQNTDEVDKPLQYARLGVAEYFQYDPTGDYLVPQLKGSRLVAGQYQPLVLQQKADGTPYFTSQVLGLELRLLNGELRFFETATDKKLLSHGEETQSRQEVEAAKQELEQARTNAISRLLAMGLSVEQVAEALSLSVAEVRDCACQ